MGAVIFAVVCVGIAYAIVAWSNSTEVIERTRAEFDQDDK